MANEKATLMAYPAFELCAITTTPLFSYEESPHA